MYCIFFICVMYIVHVCLESHPSGLLTSHSWLGSVVIVLVLLPSDLEALVPSYLSSDVLQ